MTIDESAVARFHELRAQVDKARNRYYKLWNQVMKYPLLVYTSHGGTLAACAFSPCPELVLLGMVLVFHDFCIDDFHVASLHPIGRSTQRGYDSRQDKHQDEHDHRKLTIGSAGR
jgi:hypothetical protein